MRLGMFMHPIHDFKRGYHTLLFEDLDVIRAADQEGFDEVWLGEHYLLPSEPFASPLMLYARLIVECPRITFGSGVLCLPNKHPALVAGEVAQFDHLAKGRFMLGIGPGAAPPDFELFGCPRKESHGDARGEHRHDDPLVDRRSALRDQRQVLAGSG